MNPQSKGPRPDNRIAIYMAAFVLLGGGTLIGSLATMQWGLGSLTNLFEGDERRVLKLVLVSIGLLAVLGASVNFIMMKRGRKRIRNDE